MNVNGADNTSFKAYLKIDQNLVNPKNLQRLEHVQELFKKQTKRYPNDAFVFDKHIPWWTVRDKSVDRLMDVFKIIPCITDTFDNLCENFNDKDIATYMSDVFKWHIFGYDKIKESGGVINRLNDNLLYEEGMINELYAPAPELLKDYKADKKAYNIELHKLRDKQEAGAQALLDKYSSDKGYSLLDFEHEPIFDYRA
ncbi:MAG: hypothetical protein MJ237_00460 [bacterium]|nr:hypothetical protein [bacterium]